MKTRKGYLILRNKTYYACWTVASKKFMKSTGKTNRREAEKRLAEIMEPFLIENEIKTLQNVKARIEGAKAELVALDEKRNPPLTIACSWDSYLLNPNRPDSGPETLRQYESHYDQFCAWLKENHPTVLTLQAIIREIAEEYAANLTKRSLSANRFNKHIRFLELFFRVLKDNGRLSINPWESINRKRQISMSRRELTIDELKKVCLTATGGMRLLFAVGIYTGLRLGDCATLRWGEVDLRRGRISRIPNKTARRNPKPVLVPIHSVLNEILNEIPPENRKEYVIPQTAADYLRDPAILTNRAREHFENNGIRVHKLDTGNGTEKRAVVEVGFHSLRHTFVSMCREANAPLSVVEAIVGHGNPAMTRHYTHVSELAAASAVNSLPAVMGNTSALALPPAKMIAAASIRAALDKMNGKTWRKVKAELLAVIG